MWVGVLVLVVRFCIVSIVLLMVFVSSVVLGMTCLVVILSVCLRHHVGHSVPHVQVGCVSPTCPALLTARSPMLRGLSATHAVSEGVSTVLVPISVSSVWAGIR